MEYEYPLAVIGVDPGGTTGVAEYVIDSADQPAEFRQPSQIGDPGSVYLVLQERAAEYRGSGYNVVFVVEQFDKRPGVVDPDFTPKYIINDINRFMPNETIVWQTPAQAKNLVKPVTSQKARVDGLKRFGWYKTGMGHANDASRHVIVFLVEKLKHKPTILKGWPKRG